MLCEAGCASIIWQTFNFEEFVWASVYKAFHFQDSAQLYLSSYIWQYLSSLSPQPRLIFSNKQILSSYKIKFTGTFFLHLVSYICLSVSSPLFETPLKPGIYMGFKPISNLFGVIPLFANILCFPPRQSRNS